ncbi:hypothetical protein B938_14480 [Bacillus velezensis AS43.3]|nr:hypothetical protein B938_14480 [Bacillus velezensis AS43.3]
MKILQMSYKKRGTIEFVFEDFPHSKVTMRRLKGITLFAPLNGADGTEPSPAMI